jgi:hypothetical protein
MANGCDHTHSCFECRKLYVCWSPECMTLPGPQGLCVRCSYNYGWKQKQERATQDDWSVL